MDVKTLCLGVLTERDLTGYEIKRHFEEAFCHFFVAGYGSIYPALADLTRRGLVSCTSVLQEKRPDKKVYSLTPAGREALIGELMSTPPRHKVRSEFLVLMVFAHLLPAAKIAQIADEMVAQWDELLASIDGCVAEDDGCLSPGMRFAVGYGRAVTGAARAYVADNKDRLIETIEKEAVAKDAAD
ncbi:MAG: PadR family transcriptional regulator [Alphaproteobacteria bacterium]